MSTRLRRLRARSGWLIGRIILRRLGKSREQRGFFQFQLLCRFAEIVFRGSLISVSAVAEKNLVGVEREDLRLGEAALDLDGEQRLLHLAIKRAVGREKQIARELHGERGCSLHFPAGFDIAIRRAYDAPEVDARVPVEILVFDRDQRVAENFRIIVIGGDDAALQREGADDSALSVIEFGDGAGAVTFEFFDLWQVRRVDQQQARRPRPPRRRAGRAIRTRRVRPASVRQFLSSEDVQRQVSRFQRFKVSMFQCYRKGQVSRFQSFKVSTSKASGVAQVF